MSFEIPPGLTAMLQDFTVAVLRTKPPDLYKFAAEHFSRLYAEKGGPRVSSVAPEASPEPGSRRESPVVRNKQAGFAASPDRKTESANSSPGIIHAGNQYAFIIAYRVKLHLMPDFQRSVSVAVAVYVAKYV